MCHYWEGGKPSSYGWRIEIDPASIGCLVAIGGERGEERVEVQDYLESHGLARSQCETSDGSTSPTARSSEPGPKSWRTLPLVLMPSSDGAASSTQGRSLITIAARMTGYPWKEGAQLAGSVVVIRERP